MGRRNQDVIDVTSLGDVDTIGFILNVEESDDIITVENYRCTVCFDTFTGEEMKGNINKCPSCGEEDCIDQP